jgi:hypothetical protein
MNDCCSVTIHFPGYYPGCEGDTEPPYYGRMDLIKADDKRMIRWEKTQARQELYRFLIFVSVLTTALTYLFCSLL